VPILIFEAFIKVLEENYLDNPYHNYVHCVDVCHACYLYLTKYKAGELLQLADILALLISALCHDINHPGLNNSFHVKQQSELAKL
jgi:hypothetical protein